MLDQAEGIRHFCVLAPNLTIYNKLIADFTPNTPKYVFQGIAEFAVTPPEIITGDNYESGRGIRQKGYLPGIEWETPIHINIFNISKITSTETPKGAIKSNIPRFRRLQDRTLVFTAITRAEHYVVIIGDRLAFEQSVVEPPNPSRRQAAMGLYDID